MGRRRPRLPTVSDDGAFGTTEMVPWAHEVASEQAGVSDSTPRDLDQKG